jgi:hypothetical protein
VVNAFSREHQQRAADLVRQFEGLCHDLGIASLL